MLRFGIARDIGDRRVEAESHATVSALRVSQEEWDEATAELRQAIEIADDIDYALLSRAARESLAPANVHLEDLAAAREMVEAARKYDVPLSNHRSSAILGVVALRQGDHKAAREAFSAGINESARLVALSADNYEALDSLGLSPCGLAVCNNSEHIPEAIAAYKAARGMPSDNGIVRNVLQRFDALAHADMDGILAEVRPAAAGTEQPQSAGHMAL